MATTFEDPTIEAYESEAVDLVDEFSRSVNRVLMELSEAAAVHRGDRVVRVEDARRAIEKLRPIVDEVPSMVAGEEPHR